MKIRYKAVLALCSVVGIVVLADDSTQPKAQDDYPVGDPRRCTAQGDKDLLRLEVIPGGGWDNLRNKDAGMLMKLNYSKCRTTLDGRYLVPDDVYTIPEKSSRVGTYAELFTHWNNYSSTLSRTVNAHAGLKFSRFGISGKYSREYEKVKTRQFFDKAATTRVQVRYVRYIAKTQPDFALDDAFKARLKKIAAHIELNRTDLATYESQMVVREFGTHVTTSVDMGAALVQVDQVKESVIDSSEHERNTLLKAASGSFFSVFKLGFGHSKTVSKETMDEYLENRTHSEISTYGGPVFWPENMTMLDWSQFLDNDLVALDRSGDPIYFLISSTTLPDLPDSTVYQVHDYIKTAVELYYEYNTYRGCTKRDSPNFSFIANEDDGSCETPVVRYTFGGVFQNCTSSQDESLCKDLQQTNPLTGDFSCPDEYETVLLHESRKHFTIKRRKCHRCKAFHRCCKDKSYDEYASYQAYWCSPKHQNGESKGFIFGGLYTPTSFNPTTQAIGCPPKFYPLHLLNDLSICVSDDYEQALQDALPFAGLFSCKSGNPLALQEFTFLRASGDQHTLLRYLENDGQPTWPQECPLDFSQHLATVDNGCQVNYCIRTGALTHQALPKIKSPPFLMLPHDILQEETEYSFSDDGATWTTMEDIADTAKIIDKPRLGATQANIADNTDMPQTKPMSTGVIAGISIGGTLTAVLGIIAAVIVFKKRREYRTHAGMTYGTIGDTRILDHIEEENN